MEEEACQAARVMRIIRGDTRFEGSHQGYSGHSLELFWGCLIVFIDNSIFFFFTVSKITLDL